MNKKESIRVAMVDDHVLLRDALANLIDDFGDCKVILKARNGRELTEMLHKEARPDIILLDLNMQEMNGFETANWLKQHHPDIYVIMLTMYDAEASMIRLLQAGVRGFLKKDVHPSELRQALHAVMDQGYYYSHHMTGKLVNLFRHQGDQGLQKNLMTEQEIAFLRLASTEMTYKEIAMHLSLTPRAVDNLRDHMFEKLDVKSRVGLVMFAIRQGLVQF